MCSIRPLKLNGQPEGDPDVTREGKIGKLPHQGVHSRHHLTVLELRISGFSIIHFGGPAPEQYSFSVLE